MRSDRTAGDRCTRLCLNVWTKIRTTQSSHRQQINDISYSSSKLASALKSIEEGGKQIIYKQLLFQACVTPMGVCETTQAMTAGTVVSRIMVLLIPALFSFPHHTPVHVFRSDCPLAGRHKS